MKVNLTKASGNSNPGAAAPKNEIILMEAEYVTFPPSDENGVLLEGNFVLADEEKMITIYSTKSKTDASMESEGDEDMNSFKSKLTLMHPGNSKEVKEFVQYWSGRNVIAMHKACGENHYEVMGTPCAPLQLKAAKQDNNDGRAWTLNFEPFAKSGYVPKIYEGAVVFAEPFEVADVAAVPLLVANGYHYKLPALAVTAAIAIDGITLAHGKIITLIGSGGADPATLANGVTGDVTTLLVGGTSWTALNKSVINLKVFIAGATTHLIELSRE
ncbi:hypothetical protein [Flavobacterium sp. HNIBRBA15423]|uniref:hypothetical protein n=1 Tax=Flavobacterium sp. HNIBRBA15423 TaxID=3458683 RepID=UPI0040446D0F